MRLSRTVLVVGLLTASGCLQLPLDPAGRPEEPEARIQGTWVSVDSGNNASGLPAAGCRLVITESRFDILSSTGVVAAPGSYSADFHRFPHPIDVITTVRSSDGKPVSVHQEVVLGIIKVEGDTLTLCLDASTGPKVRPRRFANEGEKMFEDRGRTFLQAVFRREPLAKPAAKTPPPTPPRPATASKPAPPTPRGSVADAEAAPKPAADDGWRPRRSAGASAPVPSADGEPKPAAEERELLPIMPTPE